MTNTELEMEYYVVGSVERNSKQVYICINKKSSDYDFFVYNSNSLEKVDKNLEQELRKIYHNNPTSAISLINVEATGDGYEDIERYNKNVKLIINSIAKKLAPNVQKEIFGKYCRAGIRKYNSATAPESSAAYYCMASNSIYVKPMKNGSLLDNYHAFLHESLHACSTSRLGNSVGFMRATIARDGDDNDRNLFFIQMGNAFNEGYTECLCIDTLKNLQKENPQKFGNLFKFSSGYDIITTLTNALIRDLDQEKVKEYYFTGNLNGMIMYMNNFYHIKNKNTLFEIFYGLDAINSSYKYSYKSDVSVFDKKIAYSDRISFALKIANSIARIKFNKIVFEGGDVANINAKDIVPDYFTTNCTVTYKEIISSLNNSLPIMKVLATFDFDENQKAIDLYDANVLLEKLLKNNTLSIPEKVKTPEFYFSILSKKCCRPFISQMQYNALMENFLKAIFNPINDYMPSDPGDRERFILQFLSYEKILGIKVAKYLPQKDFAKVVNHHPEMLLYILRTNFGFLLKMPEDLSSEIKRSNQFLVYIELLKIKFKKETVCKYLGRFYKSFTVKERKSAKFQEAAKRFYLNRINGGKVDDDYKNFVKVIDEDSKALKNKQMVMEK